jgi:DNA polymerase
MAELKDSLQASLAFAAEAGAWVLPGSRQPARAPALERDKAHPPADLPILSTPEGGPLALIREQIGDCQRCRLHQGRTHIVFGVGSPAARLMFVGEGPGEEEDRQGEPFVGRAGKLLDKMIRAMGMERGDVYIANVVKCRPPKNRDPAEDEVATCLPFLREQIEAIRPTIICALGSHAAKNLLGRDDPIGKLRGRVLTVGDWRVVATYHPAYLLRTPSAKRLVWQDLKLVLAELGKEA